MGLRAIPQRLGVSLVVVIGMACVVGVTISILSISTTYNRPINSTGRPDQALVISQGSQFENNSSIPRASLVTISNAPGIKKGTDGKLLVSPEFIQAVPVTKKRDGFRVYVGLRGIGPRFFDVHPEAKLIRGRMFMPGKRELIVGKGAAQEFSGLDVGGRLALPIGDWTVTGVFDSNGDILGTQLLGDADTVIAAMRLNVFRSVWVLLQRPDAFDQFKHALTTDPTLNVDVETGPEFWQVVSKGLGSLLTLVAYGVGGIMGLGAVFAALNTMYSVVSTRSVEIATLRAIGFDGRVVVTSVLIEAMGLAGAGAVIGAAVAWFAFNGNPHVAGQVVINLTITPSLMAHGVAYACGLGFIGGLLPALRAATIPVTSALRAI